MDKEILLIIIVEIILVMICMAIRLYLLTNEAMRFIRDRESLIEEGYLQKPTNQ